jgi:hypothetical protein
MLPYWASSVDRVAVVGGHVFYKWKGFLGERGSFRQAYAGYEPSEDLGTLVNTEKAIDAANMAASFPRPTPTSTQLDEGAADEHDRFGLLDFRQRSLESSSGSADALEVDHALSEAFAR